MSLNKEIIEKNRKILLDFISYIRFNEEKHYTENEYYLAIENLNEQIINLLNIVEKNQISLMQYNNLRKQFNRLIKIVLGENYYNMAMDVYKSDEFAVDDIIAKKVKIMFPTKKMIQENNIQNKTINLMAKEILRLDIAKSKFEYNHAKMWDTEEGIIKYFTEKAGKE